MGLVQEQTFADAIKLDASDSSTNFGSSIQLAIRPTLPPERQLLPVEQRAPNHVAASEQGMAK
jgi:hypothetical protein